MRAVRGRRLLLANSARVTGRSESRHSGVVLAHGGGDQRQLVEFSCVLPVRHAASPGFLGLPHQLVALPHSDEAVGDLLAVKQAPAVKADITEACTTAPTVATDVVDPPLTSAPNPRPDGCALAGSLQLLECVARQWLNSLVKMERRAPIRSCVHLHGASSGG